MDPYLIASIINVESRYNTKAVSSKSAKGLMQITTPTGEWLGELMKIEGYEDENLHDPELNIRMGTWYMKKLISDFDGDLDLALAAYNAGTGNVRKWLNNEEYSSDGKSLDIIPFKETENYLKKVYRNYNVYKRIYKNQLDGSNKESINYMEFLHELKELIPGIN